MKQLWNAGVLLAAMTVAPAWAQKLNLPPNDFETSTKSQITDLRETIAGLNAERDDVIDRRGNLSLRIIKEILKEKVDEAAAKKDTAKMAYYQKEIDDLQTFRDEIWKHSIKVKELNHQYEQLRMSLLSEVNERSILYYQGLKNDKAVAILNETKAFLDKARQIEDQKFDLSKKALEVKMNDDFQAVPEIRQKIQDLQKQYDKLLSDTQEKLKEIGLEKNNPLLST